MDWIGGFQTSVICIIPVKSVKEVVTDILATNKDFVL